MRRLKLVVLLSLAVILAAQPLLHHHSLGIEGAPTCSVCAFGADARVHAPAIHAPLVLARTYDSLVVTVTPAEVVRATSARAPPAG